MADNQVICPFCGEKDFDLIGLKTHFERGWCHEFTATKPVGYLPFCGNRPTANNRSDEIAWLESFLVRARDVFAGVSDFHWLEVTINERIAQLRAVR